MAPLYVAVDGPAGSGKSAIFSAVARRLQMRFLDTGLFYRAFCWSVLHQGRDAHDEASVCQALRSWRIRFEPPKQLFVSDETGESEISAECHTHEIDSWVSIIASHPKVRASMVDFQRKLALECAPCIVLGRDVTSVVLADAPLKIYLDSSVAVRAQRRHAQLLAEQSNAPSLQEVADAIAHRDALDRSRSVGPLVQTADSVYINNDDATLEEAIQRAAELVRSRLDLSEEAPCLKE